MVMNHYQMLTQGYSYVEKKINVIEYQIRFIYLNLVHYNIRKQL